MTPRPFRDPVTGRPISYATATARVQQYAAERRVAAVRLAQATTARSRAYWTRQREAWAGAVVDLAEQRRALIAEEMMRLERRAAREAVKESRPTPRVGPASQHWFGADYKGKKKRGTDIRFEVMLVAEQPISDDAARAALRRWTRLGETPMGVTVEAFAWEHNHRGRWNTTDDPSGPAFDDLSHLLRAVQWQPQRHGVPKKFGRRR